MYLWRAMKIVFLVELVTVVMLFPLTVSYARVSVFFFFFFFFFV